MHTHAYTSITIVHPFQTQMQNCCFHMHTQSNAYALECSNGSQSLSEQKQSEFNALTHTSPFTHTHTKNNSQWHTYVCVFIWYSENQLQFYQTLLPLQCHCRCHKHRHRQSVSVRSRYQTKKFCYNIIKSISHFPLPLAMFSFHSMFVYLCLLTLRAVWKGSRKFGQTPFRR